jgi:hypothetical protein
MQKYIAQLNEAQREPVFKKDGPMIIIAGAGSGKTCFDNTYRLFDESGWMHLIFCHLYE